MTETMDLYQAILTRHSTRRYAKRSLDADALERVRSICAEAHPLAPENLVQCLVRDVTVAEDLTQAIGAYGRIFSVPHYLVPCVVGDAHPLTDLGYRVEQIAVRLNQMGIDSCYVGTLKQEEAIRRRFELPTEARIGALLAFGRPTAHPGGRAFNAIIKRAAGATRKHPSERIFYRETFADPISPPEELAPLIEAARHAPSAVNAQPWRFLWHGGTLYLYVQRENARYGRGPAADYRLYDGGICMANVALALEALDKAGRWQMLAEGDPQVPSHPAGLQPLAKLA